MNLFSERIIKNLFQKYSVKPAKRLGQHFLVDKRVLQKIIRTANLKPEETVLEVGPGIGNLTRELAKRVKKVITIEKDPKMVEILKEQLKDFKNLKIIQTDILKTELSTIPSICVNLLTGRKYKIVANLPYYIVSPVIRKFLESQIPPKEMILMVQKEVAQRICARPPKMNLLAISVQFYAQPKIISFVSRKSFWPQPKVDSAIIRIAPLIDADRKLINADLFFRIVRAGFSQPRKQLINNLSRLNFSSKNLSGQAKKPKLNREKVKRWLLKNKIQPVQRAETLTLRDWLKLTKSFPG